ncbi:hypothetical protein [Streptomyces sp. cg35]
MRHSTPVAQDIGQRTRPHTSHGISQNSTQDSTQDISQETVTS